VIVASDFLAGAARQLGARDVRIIPSGVDVPDTVGEPSEPPHVLYVGRLSTEKGILDFLEATEGISRVIVGDGPLRRHVPEALGFIERSRLGGYYERASIVCVPSHREGYGVVAREAMAYGRPVVATAVGGLPDAVENNVTGMLVPAGEPQALRDALEDLLVDTKRRAALGREGRIRAQALLTHRAAATAISEAYRAVAQMV
jgi:glycosyltransferase involved in cell wall biosynthesis